VGAGVGEAVGVGVSSGVGEAGAVGSRVAEGEIVGDESPSPQAVRMRARAIGATAKRIT
jgi:hypothetical protein